MRHCPCHLHVAILACNLFLAYGEQHIFISANVDMLFSKLPTFINAEFTEDFVGVTQKRVVLHVLELNYAVSIRNVCSTVPNFLHTDAGGHFLSSHHQWYSALPLLCGTIQLCPRTAFLLIWLLSNKKNLENLSLFLETSLATTDFSSQVPLQRKGLLFFFSFSFLFKIAILRYNQYTKACTYLMYVIL